MGTLWQKLRAIVTLRFVLLFPCLVHVLFFVLLCPLFLCWVSQHHGGCFPSLPVLLQKLRMSANAHYPLPTAGSWWSQRDAMIYVHYHGFWSQEHLCDNFYCLAHFLVFTVFWGQILLFLFFSCLVWPYVIPYLIIRSTTILSRLTQIVSMDQMYDLQRALKEILCCGFHISLL